MSKASNWGKILSLEIGEEANCVFFFRFPKQAKTFEASSPADQAEIEKLEERAANLRKVMCCEF